MGNNTIALAGNPNAGKTTLFNALTGARQHVGNYPGVTVEKKEGSYVFNGHKLHIVDLPGTYSLTAYSMEEVVARNFLVNEKPAVVVNIVDASNLERNLYLAVQFLELGVPLCIALNMIDVAKNRGIEVKADKLSELLGVPVIPTIARSGFGKMELMKSAVKMIEEGGEKAPLEISYGEDVDRVLLTMEEDIGEKGFLTDTYPARWVALKYLENDEQILSKGRLKDPELAAYLEESVEKLSNHLQRTLETYPEAMITDHRYGYINSILKQGIVHTSYDHDRIYTSDKIDQVLTHRFLGPIIMLAVLVVLYKFTFTYGEVPVGWFEDFFAWLDRIATAFLPEGLFRSLLISGVIDGVGGVLGFVPLIMFMFFGIAIIEDSGYFARVAYMLDRIFRWFGLQGSSVMPFIVSGGIAGGCAVPGVLATRTLKSPKERLTTMLTAPFMNCGAKLPVFALLIAAFFSENEAGIMFGLTIMSWVGALLAAKFLRSSVVRGESTPFVLELPPYRFPTFRGLLIHTWERTWQYIKKAGTVILAISILLWALMTFPRLPDARMKYYREQRETVTETAPASVLVELENAGSGKKLSSEALEYKLRLASIDGKEAEDALRYSLGGCIGLALERITRFAGFDWITSIALVGGFAAKEVIVSTLATAYSMGDATVEESRVPLSKTLAESPDWSPLVAIALMVFIVFYSPCFVTVIAIVRESGSWKWGLFSMTFNTLLALVCAILVYQVGSMMGY